MAGWKNDLIAAERACADVGATWYPPSEQSQTRENGAGSKGDRSEEFEHDHLQIHLQSMMRVLRFAVVTICLRPIETREQSNRGALSAPAWNRQWRVTGLTKVWMRIVANVMNLIPVRVLDGGQAVLALNKAGRLMVFVREPDSGDLVA